jgi:hypothetical protein
MPAGRPPFDRAPAIAEVVARLSKGEPLAQICRDEGMPAPETIRLWMRQDEEISAAIAQAREDGFDQIAMDALLIADDANGDFIDTEEGQRFQPEHVQRSKLKVETRLKLLAKWDPKRYGEQQAATNINLSNAVTNIVQVSEDRRRELIERKKAANERLRALKAQAKEAKQPEG